MIPPRTRILIADDEITARLMLQAALEKCGFDVSAAEDGEEVLRKFREQPSDMVMLDVEMPGLNGYQVCSELRKLAGNELPIVMVTGMDDLKSIERAFDSGATDFIAKPINWALLGHRVRYLMRARKVLQDLHTANAQNAAILNAIPDSLLRLDTNGQILDVRMVGWEQDDQHFPMLGRALADCLPIDIATQIMTNAALVNATGEATNLEIKFTDTHGEGHYYEVRLGQINEQETLCLVRDITERKNSEHRIHHLAYYDSLTGLPNRASFSEHLSRMIRRTQHHNGKMAVLFVDLDGFKNVNDTLGYVIGDHLLQGMADRMRQGLRPMDLVARADFTELDSNLARLGGDEFTVLIPELQQTENVLSVARRVHELMSQPFMLKGREVVLSVSIGIALYPDDGEDAESLLKHADTAMYHAKNQGRNNFQFYNTSLTQAAMRRLDLESNLRHALERDEFYLVYQPQLDVASGRIHSLEALIRWRHPVQGMISPMDFIPAAEENGLIVPIGEWVIRTACANVARWHASGYPLRVAVNLSARQFRNPNLHSLITAILQETGLSPEFLELEVTEGALMEDTASTLAILNALRDLGVQLSLDDFGTGYSSLSYLKRLPLNNLKVDQSFIRGLPADKESLAIVRAIVSLAKNLGFTLTAEGIETLEQAGILSGLDCELLQGYYFSKPVPAGDIPALLEQRWKPKDGQEQHTIEFAQSRISDQPPRPV